MFSRTLFCTGAAYVKKCLMLNMIEVFPPLFHDLHFPVNSHHCLEPPWKNLPEKLPAPFAAPMRTTGGKNKVFRCSIKSTRPSEQANKPALRDESRPAGKQDRTASSADEEEVEEESCETAGRDDVCQSGESVPSAREDAAGSRGSLTAGGINRPLTTQLPAAGRAAACRPGQMHRSRVSSSSHIVLFFSFFRNSF